MNYFFEYIHVHIFGHVKIDIYWRDIPHRWGIFLTPSGA
jgi:hypothetical protein